jgi:FAD/FMN-containing dehydrogenase
MQPEWLRALANEIDGRVIDSADADMVLANKQHASYLPFAGPDAVILCTSSQDVAHALSALRSNNAPFSIRSGGHCFADHSSEARFILDLRELSSLEVKGDHVRLGVGLTTGHAVQQLASHDLAIPTGGCPGVAIGGFGLVGGFGFSGRRLGLFSDRITDIEGVLADGRIVTINPQQHPDLYWALRGGGSVGLCVVTLVEVKAAPLIHGTACLGMWPLDVAKDIIMRWQSYAPSAPDHVNIELSLLSSDDLDEPCFIKLYGGISGHAADIASDISGMLEAFAPYANDIALVDMQPRDFAEHLVGYRAINGELAWQPSYPFQRVAYQATRSQFIASPCDANSIAALISNFETGRAGIEAREVEFIPWGGAYARPSRPSCFAHRDASILVRHTTLGGSRATTEQQARLAEWAERSWQTLQKHDTGHYYQGYAERDRSEWAQANYADDLERLILIKNEYDPDRLFRGSQKL